MDYNPLQGGNTHRTLPIAPIGNFESNRLKVLSNHLPMVEPVSGLDAQLNVLIHVLAPY